MFIVGNDNSSAAILTNDVAEELSLPTMIMFGSDMNILYNVITSKIRNVPLTFTRYVHNTVSGVYNIYFIEMY